MMLQVCFLVLSMLARWTDGQAIVNGQIHTPGFALVDSPQPNTPLGGDTLHVALDVSSDGQLKLPPYPSNSPSAIYNITIFLSSYATGKNFTVSNGTAGAGNASLGEIMSLEPGSTVKHVNWIWPDCLVGNGSPDGSNSSRGNYNISIRQNFRTNGTEMYTIFDLPIEVTNKISEDAKRPSCDTLNNPMIDQAALNASANAFTRIPGNTNETSGKGPDAGGPDVGGPKPDGTPLGGTGGATSLHWSTAACAAWIGVLGLMVLG